MNDNKTGNKLINLDGTPSNKGIIKDDVVGDNLYEKLFQDIDPEAEIKRLNEKGELLFKTLKRDDPDNKTLVRPPTTTVNYLPSEFVVILKGTGFVKVMDLVNTDVREIFKRTQIVFSVAGYGYAVKPFIEIGDYIDIRDTSAVAHRPMFYNPDSIDKWKAHMKDQRELIIGGASLDKEKRSKRFVNLTLPEVKEGNKTSLFTGSETVKITEYFVTEEFNIYGVFGI